MPTTGLRLSRTTSNVAAAESAPSGTTEGVDCRGYSQVAVLVADFHADISDFDCEVWLYDGTNWAQAVDADGAVLAWDTVETTFAQVFSCAGFDRFFLRVDAINTVGGTTMDRSYAVTGPPH